MSETGFRVATYNVHDCVGRDGAYAPDRIAAIVADLGADVVALQEVTLDHAGDVIALLERTTGMRAIEGTLFERGVGRYGNVLLARWPAVTQRLHDLSFASREPRGLIDIVFDVDGCDWRILATHLGLSWQERRHQLRRVSDMLTATDRPTVVMGDFNIWLSARAFVPLTRLGFAQCQLATFPTWPLPLFSLDRILVGPLAYTVRCARVMSATARVASDHYPLCADLRQAGAQ